MLTRRAERFVSGFHFAECPRWHQGVLWLSDFFEPAIYTVSSDGRAQMVHKVPGEPAGLGWLSAGELLVVSRTNRKLLQMRDGSVTEYADLSELAPFYANDLAIGAGNTAYVSHFGFDLDTYLEANSFETAVVDSSLPGASILVVHGNGDVQETKDRLRFPNGIAITADGRQLIVAETLGERLTVFDVMPDHSLAHPEVWAETPGIAPDGICMDGSGAMWVANLLAAECLRIERGGRVLERIQTEENSFACCLGGDDGRTLFITTAPSSHAVVASRTRASAIEYVRVNIPGWA